MGQFGKNKILGKICIRRHDYKNTGKSLRYRKSRVCIECSNLRAVGYRESGRKSKSQATYYLKNREKELQRQERYRLENREKINTRNRRRYQKNKKQARARARAYRNAHHEQILANQRRYRLSHKESRNAYQRKYMKKQRDENSSLAIGNVLRGKVRQAFVRYTKTGKIRRASEYGIDYAAIIQHLGPHPNALGIDGQWHIDHIIPVSAFDLNDLEQVKIAFAPSNHRWLPSHENLNKSSKMPSADIVPVELLAMLENHNIGVLANG